MILPPDGEVWPCQLRTVEHQCAGPRSGAGMVTEPMRPEFSSTTSTRSDAMPGCTRGKNHHHHEPQRNQPSHRETILSVRITFAMDGLASEKAESTTDYAPRLSVAVDG